MRFPAWQIERRDMVTGKEDIITRAEGSGIRPIISPDGNHLVYGTRYTQGFMAKAYGYDDTKVDLDIYVFDCTEEKCEPAKVDADPKGQEIVYISNPKAGKWKIVVDAFSMDGESTSFEYLDAVFNPIDFNVLA